MFKNNTFEKEYKLNKCITEMLGDLSINVDENDHLSDTQKKAFELYKQCKILLILGGAGCGKSHVLNTMEHYTKTQHSHKNVYITSTTGISAHHIGGTTINSLFGVGTGEAPVEMLVKKVSQKIVYRDRIRQMDILFIDEISMLSADLFEKINIICQKIRGNKLFFGGIQLILTGDFLQLTPVFNKQFNENMDDRLLIESDIFIKHFNKKNGNVIILTQNFRQQKDPSFINLLMKIRTKTFNDNDISVLNNRKIKKSELDICKDFVHLVSSNKKAQIINESRLEKLKDPMFIFNTIYTIEVDNEITKLIHKELQYQFKQKNIETLNIKKGARVMLIKNLDISLGLVNGALGTVQNMIRVNNNFCPEVLFDNNVKKIIEPVTWDLEMDNYKCSAMQIPLMLAYACTVHKSQGQTLQNAVLDLEDAFCDHMVYVALSRVVSIDGLYLKSFNPSKIKINDKMKKYLDELN